MKELYDFARVFLQRALPGILNLCALLLVSKRLSNADFGFYSTSLASVGVLTSFIYGPVVHSIVSQYSKAERLGRGEVYVASLLISAALISLLPLSLTLLPLITLRGITTFLLLLVSLGCFHILQEIFRAKLKFHTYAICAILQSGLFILLVYVYLSPESGYLFPLGLLAASYFVGTCYGLYSLKAVWTKPDISTLKGVARIGFPYTLSTLSEGAIGLGFRYALLFFAGPGYLGIFSFCLDFAQRTVGFIVSVGGFFYVPMAFRHERGEFGALLNRGGILSVIIALTGHLVLILYLTWESPLSIKMPAFDAAVYFWLGLAVIFNRTKKLVLDPLVMRDNRVSCLFWGYFLAALGTIPILALVCNMGSIYMVPYLYLGAFFAAAVVSWRLYGLARAN